MLGFCGMVEGFPRCAWCPVGADVQVVRVCICGVAMSMGTPRNIIRGVGLREILFAEWDSVKYYSRSRPPLSVVSPCDWVLLWWRDDA